MICLAAGAATPAGADNVVLYTSTDEVHTFDPHSVWHLETLIATGQVYERLPNVGAKLEPEPALATSWRVVDRLTWESQRRDGSTAVTRAMLSSMKLSSESSPRARSMLNTTSSAVSVVPS
jgi:ABC-type transport system substrate-binding protein